jgi:hypothetical protein
MKPGAFELRVTWTQLVQPPHRGFIEVILLAIRGDARAPPRVRLQELRARLGVAAHKLTRLESKLCEAQFFTTL